jgi:hypothetical protein
MNVLEHVEEEDLASLKRMRRLIAHNGVLILLVPAHMFLYNKLDEAIGHRRRCEKRGLLRKLAEAVFLVRKVFYHDVFGIPRWYMRGSILKRTTPPSATVAFKYLDRLVPLFTRSNVFSRG